MANLWRIIIQLLSLKDYKISMKTLFCFRKRMREELNDAKLQNQVRSNEKILVDTVFFMHM